ncbi:Sensory box histidine kinase [Chitinispirillum alkaliphilum]|nr:Sensory box histidine kinase [Chitinispirillum alkaliphilum]
MQRDKANKCSGENGSQQKLECERKQKELLEGLFGGNVTMQRLLQSLAQGVVVIDGNRNILLFNAAAERMFGYTASEIIGKPHDLLVPARFNKTHTKQMAGYFKDPKVRPMGIGMDLYARRRNGSEFPVEISLSFVNIKNEMLVLSLITDISVRKETEQALKQRMRDLAEVNDNLESFSYSVSHDLKTPLQAIHGFATILVEDNQELEPEAKEYLIRISQSAQRMKELIDDMLELSKITRKDLIKQHVNLSDLAREIVEQLAQGDHDRNVHVAIDEDLYAYADVTLAKVVLGNLLGNAWKFTSKREVSQIKFTSLVREGRRIFLVSDNGAGFDMKHMEKLFAPFRRLHSDQEFPGTGAGLAIVQRVIKRHGGEIWAESQVGKGTSFYFTFEEE